MLLAIAFLLGIAVIGSVIAVSRLAPSQPQVMRRLDELAPGGVAARDTVRRRHRQDRAARLQAILEQVGSRVEGTRRDLPEVRLFLLHAGYSRPSAVPVYLGARLLLALSFAGVLLLLIPLAGARPALAIFGAIWGGLLGWIMPVFMVGRRVKARQLEIVKALPDALDLLVVCVEAGLGLNQALVRVADEIGTVSTVLGDQLTLTNLEIRAGTARDDALRNLAERTGVDDLQSFVGMLIQTDRFGTSIAQALRTHSEVLRTKRRQRAEEAAAKTAIKMLFPLVFFIFPAMFVVILGPAVIQTLEALKNVL